MRVAGAPAQIGSRVPLGAEVTLDGRPVAHSTLRKVYLALHKPAGVLSAARDPKEHVVVTDFVRRAMGSVPPGLVPVGRLDVASRGLLLLTNDGDWMNRVLHPSAGLVRVYEVRLERKLGGEELARLAAGVKLEEGLSRLDIRPVGGFVYEVRLTRGWRREIRRAFEAIGVGVKDLCRTEFGGARLGTRTPGSVWKIPSDLPFATGREKRGPSRMRRRETRPREGPKVSKDRRRRPPGFPARPGNESRR